MTPEHAAAYLAGMIDGEGSVQCGACRWVVIYSDDGALADACMEAYAVLGVRATRCCQLRKRYRAPGTRTMYTVRVSNQDGLEAIYRLVPLRSGAKRTKLLSLLESYSRRPTGITAATSGQ